MGRQPVRLLQNTRLQAPVSLNWKSSWLRLVGQRRLQPARPLLDRSLHRCKSPKHGTYAEMRCSSLKQHNAYRKDPKPNLVMSSRCSSIRNWSINQKLLDCKYRVECRNVQRTTY